MIIRIETKKSDYLTLANGNTKQIASSTVQQYEKIKEESEVESSRTSLASKVKSLTSKPPSPRKIPCSRPRTALFFDLLKIGQGHEHFFLD